MRVLFLTKPYIIDPLGIGYLSSALKAHGHVVELEHNTGIPEKVRRFRPDVVAFSVTTGQHMEYLADAAAVKLCAPHAVTVFGGPHPTYFPRMHACVDHIVQGEADISFPWLVDALATGAPVQPHVKPWPLVENIDDIPAPDRGLIYKFHTNRSNPIKNVMTSRGCPFACIYCYNAVYRDLYAGQKILRYHSTKRIIEECRDLRDNHGARFIFFADDEFAISERRLSQITEAYRRLVGLPYHAQLRIDLLTDAKAKLLAESGCRSVTFAIESGDATYRRDTLGRKISDEQIVDGARLLHRYGIAFRTENMIGLPEETLDQAIATLDLNIACRPDMAWASLYQPYPGTVLGDRCIAQGLFRGTVNDLKPSFFEDSVLPLENKPAFINLQRLFGIVAHYPAMRRHLRKLLELPPNRLYGWIYRWWKKNRYDRKLYAY